MAVPLCKGPEFRQLAHAAVVEGNARAVERYCDSDRRPPLLLGVVLVIVEGVLAVRLQARAKGYINLDDKYTNLMIRVADKEGAVVLVDRGHSHKMGTLIEGQGGTPRGYGPRNRGVGAARETRRRRRGLQPGFRQLRDDWVHPGYRRSPGRIHKVADTPHPKLLPLRETLWPGCQRRRRGCPRGRGQRHPLAPTIRGAAAGGHGQVQENA